MPLAPAKTAPVTIIGSYVSPFVRKVLVCLDLKQVPYLVDPITPFFGDDRFSELSPLRRVPVLIDEDVTLADSTVIAQYLEDRYPERCSLYPPDIVDRARARWLEEYADTRIADVLIWGVFNKAVLEPGVWGKPRDLDGIARAMREELPPMLEYLERQLPAAGFLFDDARLSIADIAIAAMFRNLGFARQRVDAERWPVTAAFVDRTLAQPSFARLQAFEEVLMRTRIPEQRAKLAALGAPLTEVSLGAATPRQGVRRF